MMMRSRRARTQDEIPTAMLAWKSVARIGGTDKSNNQLDNDGERGRASGQKRQRQQQHSTWASTHRRFASPSAAEVNGDNMQLW
jgi:hypothetical protein